MGAGGFFPCSRYRYAKAVMMVLCVKRNKGRKNVNWRLNPNDDRRRFDHVGPPPLVSLFTPLPRRDDEEAAPVAQVHTANSSIWRWDPGRTERCTLLTGSWSDVPVRSTLTGASASPPLSGEPKECLSPMRVLLGSRARSAGARNGSSSSSVWQSWCDWRAGR